MIRPQLKDLYQGGHDISMGGKDAKKLQPPMNASPGELRLWRKLNGVLDDEEMKKDDLEHGKARSRQMKYPGTKERQAAAEKAKEMHEKVTVVSNSRDLYGENKRQPKMDESQMSEESSKPSEAGARRASMPPPRAPAPKKAPPKRASSNGGGSGTSSNQAAPQSSPRAERPPTPKRKPSPAKPRAEDAAAKPKARKPSPRSSSPRAMPPRAPPPRAPSAAKRPPSLASTKNEEAYEEEEPYDENEDAYDDEGSSAPKGGSGRSVQEEYEEGYEEEEPYEDESKSKTPTPERPTGQADKSRGKRARAGGSDGNGREALSQIEELLPQLSLEHKKELQERIAELIEMHELRSMINQR